MDAFSVYNQWLSRVADSSLQKEMAELKSNPEAILDQFGADLSFGTGGLRAEIGVGPNRLNKPVVGKATQGLCDELLAENAKPSVAIAYDTRLYSEDFALHAALVLAANGIQVYLFSQSEPTPLLSFAVRYLHCNAGIVLTASHNPATYNGYKVYGADGAQIETKASNRLEERIAKVDIFADVKLITEAEAKENKLLLTPPSEVKEAFFDEISRLSPLGDDIDRSFAIAYTPLNGAGIHCVPDCLAKNGYTKLYIPEAQKNRDVNFSSTPLPNPQAPQAMEMVCELAKEKGALLAIATDPDSDRIGCAVLHKGEMIRLNGNEVGILLTDFLFRTRKEKGTLPEKPVLVRSIVTTNFVDRVAGEYGAEIVQVLTGFKYIGEQIGLLEKKGEQNRYVFGLEESCGYLAGGYVRDKDGVAGALLICEMCAWYHSKGQSPVDALIGLYEKYGRQEERLISWRFAGLDGNEKRKAVMENFRENPMAEATVTDFDTEGTGLPRSNVLRYEFPDGSCVIIRPSGTEPEVKAYLSANAHSKDLCLKRLNELQTYLVDFFGVNPEKVM